MRICEFVDEGLGYSCYMIDVGNETATVLDPPRFPTAHEQLAAQLGVRLTWTIDTHPHADYVTGSPGLVTRRGAVFVAPAASNLETPHRPVADISGAVIDVRQTNEYAAGHVPGARNVELGQIATADLVTEPMTVMCGHGERAMTGASLLIGRGYHDVAVLDGGPDTWSTTTDQPLTVAP